MDSTKALIEQIIERADRGGRRLETAMDACEDIERLAKAALDTLPNPAGVVVFYDEHNCPVCNQPAALSAQGEDAQPAADGWRDAATAPQTGFFLAWSPDFPDMVSCWKAEIFHGARKPGTPKHLSANHFTKWMPCPLPAASQGGTE